MEINKITVRAATAQDVPALARLERQLFSDAWSESMLSDCLEQTHYSLTVGVRGNGDVVGYLISTHIAGEAELLRIGVDQGQRRQGIGRLLMECFTELCARRETPDAFLEVRRSNAGAISLYERFGFETVGKRKNYYHHPEEDALLMAGKY